jgi:hypothetical protein
MVPNGNAINAKIETTMPAVEPDADDHSWQRPAREKDDDRDTGQADDGNRTRSVGITANRCHHSTKHQQHDKGTEQAQRPADDIQDGEHLHMCFHDGRLSLASPWSQAPSG